MLVEELDLLLAFNYINETKKKEFFLFFFSKYLIFFVCFSFLFTFGVGQIPFSITLTDFCWFFFKKTLKVEIFFFKKINSLRLHKN